MAVRESTKKPQTHKNPQKATRKAKISKKNIKTKQIYFRILHNILTQNQKKTMFQDSPPKPYGKFVRKTKKNQKKQKKQKTQKNKKPKKTKNTNFQGLFETRPSAGILKSWLFWFFWFFGVFWLFWFSVRIFRTVLVESPEILFFFIVWLSVGLESPEILLLLGF